MIGALDPEYHQESSFEMLSKDEYKPAELDEGFSVLTCASFLGHIGVVRSVLMDSDGIVDINAIDGRGGNALYVACLGNRSEVVQQLLRWGADASLLVSERHLTPLMAVSFLGHDHLITLLLDYAPDCVHVVGPHGLTALYCAARGGRTECVRMLLERGGKVHVWKKCALGLFPLDVATKHKHVDVVNLLLAAAATPPPQ